MSTEIEDRNVDEATKRAQREGTRRRFERELIFLYEKMLANCRKGKAGKCNFHPALICLKSLKRYPSVHCWLSEMGFFPLLADLAFYDTVTSGAQPYENAVKDIKPLVARVQKLKAVLK